VLVCLSIEIIGCSDNLSLMNKTAFENVIGELQFDAQGLVPAIAQDAQTNEILMVAWMDRDAFLRTIETGKACYYSRSRKTAWMKGESSGHLQIVREIRIDCDGDVVLLKVDQIGGIACHTGRRNCFFRKLENGGWVTEFEPIKSEKEIYGE
jgi:phosphoribosyl-AMP cyclohydrolase